MPELNDIKVQLAGIKGDTKSLQSQVNEMDKQVTGEIYAVRDSLNIV